jgi:hypothetical protein
VAGWGGPQELGRWSARGGRACWALEGQKGMQVEYKKEKEKGFYFIKRVQTTLPKKF